MFDSFIVLMKSYKNANNIKKLSAFMLAFIMTAAVMSGAIGKVQLSGGITASAESSTAKLNDADEGTVLPELLSQEVYAAASIPQLKKVAAGDEEAEDNEPTAADLIREAILSTADEKTKAKIIAEEELKAQKEAEAEKKKQANEKKRKDNGFIYSQHIPLSYELQEYTFEKCKERKLEYELILAIMWRESRFKASAIHVNANGTRDNGIMQINDCNRKWLKEKYGITDLMDPYQNINAGTAMLSELTAKYGTHNALMAYQYGEGGMQARLKQGHTTSSATEMAYRQRDYYRTLV